jgi:hypothetical protein
MRACCWKTAPLIQWLDLGARRMDPLCGPTPRHQQKLHRQWLPDVLAPFFGQAFRPIWRAALPGPCCLTGAGTCRWNGSRGYRPRCRRRHPATHRRRRQAACGSGDDGDARCGTAAGRAWGTRVLQRDRARAGVALWHRRAGRVRQHSLTCDIPSWRPFHGERLAGSGVIR